MTALSIIGEGLAECILTRRDSALMYTQLSDDSWKKGIEGAAFPRKPKHILGVISTAISLV